LAARSWRASKGATLASMAAQGKRLANTASGWRMSIIWSKRERKKSGVDMGKSLRNLYLQ
jgi:hypothetical protein